MEDEKEESAGGHRYVRRIVCAANKTKDGLVVCGPRHCDDAMRAVAKAIGPLGMNILRNAEQGFVDQHCVWVSRTQAWEIARDAGQIVRRVGGDNANGGTLYSENLY